MAPGRWHRPSQPARPPQRMAPGRWHRPSQPARPPQRLLRREVGQQTRARILPGNGAYFLATAA
eukprot:363781-Chlamydomonas_euryale.AAC.16